MKQSKPIMNVSDLPGPDRDALLQSQKLMCHIQDLIKNQGGAIGFDQYMSTVLYEPGLGYYSAGSRKFGSEGDFITAPEISPLFSQCLAYQCAQVLNDLGAGHILELGAGTGIMACDLLLELEKLGLLPDSYMILEVSADLKQRQRELLNDSIPHLIDRVVWLDSLPDESFSGLILANEVLDALAVKRFKKVNGEYRELKVGFENDELVWVEDSVGKELEQALIKLDGELKETLPDNYISEVNLNLQKWLNGLNNVLLRGAMFFIDYGYSSKEYYHQDRNAGTLLCHYRHRVHSDPFIYPGLQDITTSANFTAVAEAADQIGLHVSGFTNQAYFLFGCGLENLLVDIAAQDIKTHTEMTQQVKKLTLPEEMGERFKVLALTKEFDQGLIGFSIMDQRVRL